VGLLAGFDEYLLGYQDRTLALTPEWAQRIVPGGNGIFLPALLVGGRIVGTWRRAEQRDTVRITVQPFEPLSPASSRSVSIAARRYGRFVELPVDLAIDSAVITGR
jgi:hypothetical protein